MPVTLTWPFLVSALVWVAATIGALVLVDAAWQVLVLLVVAAAVSVVLRPPVEALARRIPRGLAVVLVVAAATLALGGLVVSQVVNIEGHTEAIAESLPGHVEALDEGSMLREFLEEARVVERLQAALDRVALTVVLGAAEGPDAAAALGQAALVVVLAVYGILDGPRVTRRVLATIQDPGRRRMVDRALRRGVERAAAFTWASIGWGAVSGAVAYGVALGADLPGAGTLAAWVGVWSIVPVLGVVVGYAPLVVLASAESAAAAGLVALAGLLWTGIGWMVNRQVIAPRTIELGPLLVTAALVLGLQFGWLVGSFVALVAAATVAAFLAEVDRQAPGEGSPLSELVEDEPAAAGPPPQPTSGVVLGPIELRSAVRAGGLVVAAVLLVRLASSARTGLTWLVLGTLIGLALEPVARWITGRTGAPRGLAVALVLGIATSAVAVLALAAVPPLAETLRDVDQQVSDLADDLEDLPLVGDRLQELGVGDDLRRLVEDLPQDLAEDPGDPVAGAVRGAGDVLLGTLWTVVVAVAALLDGDRIFRSALVLVPHGHRRAGRDVVLVVRETVVRYAAGTATVAGFVGLWVFVTAVVVGVPLAPIVAIWALLWTFVPQVGGFLAAVPLVFFGVTQDALTGALALLSYLVAWQVKNRILHPVIVGRAVRLPPLVAIAAVLVGGAAAGVVGAILAMPLVGAARLVHEQLTAAPEPDGGPSEGPGRHQVSHPSW